MALAIAKELGMFALNKYLRNKTSKRSNGRKFRKGRKTGMRRSQAGVSSRPPTRSIMQGSFSGSIRNYFSIKDATTFYKTFTLSDLIGDQFASLAAQFTEARINAARLYFMPNRSTADPGLYAACLFDDTSASSTATPTFAEIIASPGSTCRKVYHSSGFHWKWTEPSDAEFLRIKDATQKLFVFQLATNGTMAIGGDLIVDVSLILRNQNGSVADVLCRHLDLLSGSGLSVSDWNMCLRSMKALKSRIVASRTDLSLEDMVLEDCPSLSSGDP